MYEALAREQRFGLRNYVMVAGSDADIDWAIARGAQNGLHDGRLWLRSIKLGRRCASARGRWPLEPYADAPSHSGLATLPPGRVRAVAAKALAAGFQVNTHAIGDRANRVVLSTNSPKPWTRCRWPTTASASSMRRSCIRTISRASPSSA
ncbi:MAG: hypothetical protein IPH76_19225 [Xanthomonadales bacterium]|nr:hypothetical protein [Xanthomonadales bacterium]